MSGQRAQAEEYMLAWIAASAKAIQATNRTAKVSRQVTGFELLFECHNYVRLFTCTLAIWHRYLARRFRPRLQQKENVPPPQEGL